MSNQKIDFDQIRAQADIIDVITHYIPLFQKGNNYKGVCPFHDDSNPSLTVSKEKQIYTCFSCGATGNVFTFVKEYEHISFMDAVKKVVEICNINAPNLIGKVDTYVDEKTELLYRIVEDAKLYYTYNLTTQSGAIAKKYLLDRGLNQEIIQHFMIGYSLEDGLKFVEYLKSKGYNLDEMIEAGLVTQRGNNYYDAMQGRVVFTLLNKSGKTVGFSGRRIDQSSEQKYINTAETKLFHKSSILYNYYECDKTCRRSGYTYVVEGFMDVIALFKAGIREAVATMGTAFTNEHVQDLKKLNCEIRFMFDNDSAGQNAAFKSCSIVGNKIKNLSVVKQYNIAKDIDELLTSFGKERLLQVINDLTSSLTFQIQYLKERTNLNNYEERKSLLNQCLMLLKNMDLDRLDVENYGKEIAKITNFSYQLISDSLEKKEVLVKKVEVKKQKKEKMDRYHSASRQIIYHLINDVGEIENYIHKQVFMYYDHYRKLIAHIMSVNSELGILTEADLRTRLGLIDQDLLKLLDEIMVEKYPPCNMDELYAMITQELPLSLEIKQLEDKLSQIENREEQAYIGMEIIKKKNQMNEIRRNLK